jgi:hypothetical protein
MEASPSSKARAAHVNLVFAAEQGSIHQVPKAIVFSEATRYQRPEEDARLSVEEGQDSSGSTRSELTAIARFRPIRVDGPEVLRKPWPRLRRSQQQLPF